MPEMNALASAAALLGLLHDLPLIHRAASLASTRPGDLPAHARLSPEEIAHLHLRLARLRATQPYRDEGLPEEPVYLRVLPDGREVVIEALTFDQGHLLIGYNYRSGAGWVYLTSYNYERLWDALLAAITWDGQGEPQGWVRQPDTGRRRAGGDPTTEEVRP